VDLRGFDTQTFGHLLIEEAFAGLVGLNPFAINHKLGNGTLAGACDYLFGGSWRGLDVDFPEGYVMLLQKALGDPAVRAPERGIDK